MDASDCDDDDDAGNDQSWVINVWRASVLCVYTQTTLYIEFSTITTEWFSSMLGGHYVVAFVCVCVCVPACVCCILIQVMQIARVCVYV